MGTSQLADTAALSKDQPRPTPALPYLLSLPSLLLAFPMVLFTATPWLRWRYHAVAAVLLIGHNPVWAQTATTSPAATPMAQESTLPSEVHRYLERREGCDHFRGEEGYDEARQAQINWALCQTCPGSDAGLAKLKKKYARNAAVVAKLDALDAHIEPSPAEAKKWHAACQRMPNPALQEPATDTSP